MKFAQVTLLLVFGGLLVQLPSSTFAAEDEKNSKVKIEFRLAQNEPKEGYKKVVLIAKGKGQKDETFYLSPKVELSNSDIKSAIKSNDARGKLAIGMTLTKAGGEKMRKLTQANSPQPDGSTKRLAILINGKVIMAPTINEAIRESLLISGTYTEKEVDEIVNGLNSGRAPKE